MLGVERQRGFQLRVSQRQRHDPLQQVDLLEQLPRQGVAAATEWARHVLGLDTDREDG